MFGYRFTVSTRDVLNWVRFLNSSPSLSPSLAFFHGAHLVFVDALGCGGGAEVLVKDGRKVQKACDDYLSDLAQNAMGGEIGGDAMEIEVEEDKKGRYGIPPFFIEKGVCYSSTELV